MSYLTNRSINTLNVQGGLFGVLEQAFDFIPLYLFSRGFSLPEVFGLVALMIAVRMPLRLLSIPLVHRMGLKAALMISITGYCLSFPLIGMVYTYDIWLLTYLIAFGVSNSIYWHCFHVFYSLAGEHGHRGRQVSIYLGLCTAISALSPLLGAIFVDRNSFQSFFLLSLPLLFLMLGVLSRCEDIAVARTPWSEGRKLMFNLGAKIHFAEASAVYPLCFVWIFVVYFYVDEIVSLGGIMSFGTQAQTTR